MRTLIILVIAALCAHITHAQSTFTYQGELKENAQPANGTYELRFELFSSSLGGTALDTMTRNVVVTDGLFSVELITTDSLASERWLEIAVEVTPDGMNTQVISPRQKITEAPRSSYSVRTRGIFVDSDNRVGVNTDTPTVSLEVKQNASDLEIMRLTDAIGQYQIRFRAALRDTFIQAWNLVTDSPEALFLNPEGGLTTLGPEGLAFSNGTVQTTAALRVFATATGSGSAPSGESSFVSISVPGVLPTDLVLVIKGSNDTAIPHSPTALTNQVQVIITNASNDTFGSATTSFTVVVLRP